MTRLAESDTVLAIQNIDNLRKGVQAMSLNDFFGPGSNVKVRYISDHTELVKKINAARVIKPELKLVLTMGGFDLQHIGHYRYLEIAKNSGDLLVVGLDSDEKLKKKKGDDRPINPLEERMEALAHCRHVDLITVKHSDEPKYNLIKLLKPDVLIATKGTYDEEGLKTVQAIDEHMVIQILEPQARTSTSAKMRKLYMMLADKIRGPIEKLYEDLGTIIARLNDAGEKKGE